MHEKEHQDQDSGAFRKQPPDPTERYGVKEGHERNITELHIPTSHGALRGGKETTKSGGLYIRQELEQLFTGSKSRFSFERIPVRKILREKGLPYRTEPVRGVRNAKQIIAISEYTTKRLGTLIDAGEFPIVVGGDHASVLMGIPEVLDKYPDPGNDEYSSLKMVFIDAHPDILGETKIVPEIQTALTITQKMRGGSMPLEQSDLDAFSRSLEIVQGWLNEPHSISPERKEYVELIEPIMRNKLKKSMKVGEVLDHTHIESLDVLLYELKYLLRIAGNAHGRTISTLLGEGPRDLMPIMKGRRKLKPENIFYVGIRNPDDAENKYMEKHIPKEHRKYLDDLLDWEKFNADLQEFLYENPDAPLWAEIDPDVMARNDGGKGTPMPSEEGVSRKHLYAIARDIAMRGNLVGLGTAEIARKKDEGDDTKHVLSQFFFKSLGKGDFDYDHEYNPHTVTGFEKKSPKVTVKSMQKKSLRKRILAWSGGIAATIGTFIAGYQVASHQRPKEKVPVATANLDNETKAQVDEPFAHYLQQKQGDVLNQFSRSAFRETAAQLRAAVENGDTDKAENELKAMTRIYMISRNDAPDNATASYLDELALSEFMVGFGLGSKNVNSNTYYQQFLQEKKRQKNANA